MPTYSPPAGYSYAASVTVTGGGAAVTGANAVQTANTGTDYVVQLHLTGATASSVFSTITDTVNFTDVSMWWWNGTSWQQIDCDIDKDTNGAWSTSNVTLWFKLRANLAVSPATDANYMLAWGNPSPTTMQNLANIYDFFDDFLGTALSANWTQSLATGSTLVVASSVVTITGTNSGTWNYAYTSAAGLSWGVGFALVAKTKYGSASPLTGTMAINDFRTTNASSWQGIGIRAAASTTSWVVINDAAGTFTTAVGDALDTNFHVFTVARNSGGTATGWRDNGTAHSTTGTFSTAEPIAVNSVGTTSNAPVSIAVDWVKVRPWLTTTPEPSTALGTIVTADPFPAGYNYLGNQMQNAVYRM